MEGGIMQEEGISKERALEAGKYFKRKRSE
jgi:hypothetical protein